VTESQIHRLVHGLLTETEYERLLENRAIDVHKDFDALGAVRFSIFHQRDKLALVGRVIPEHIPDLDSLGTPVSVEALVSARAGLVLVSGPCGSGKTTTLAAAIDYLNRTRPYHIISIEDPIEYRHTNKCSVIEQIEIGKDAHSYYDALRAGFRRIPDVTVIGELTDRETTDLALQLAETGHLVMATIHSRDTIQAINRIIDLFPKEQREQISYLLAEVLTGVVAQQLIPSKDGTRRILASEVLFSTLAVRNIVREQRTEQLYSVLQSGSSDGMLSMNDSLCRLAKTGTISKEEALLRSNRPKELAKMLT
jgi:twitching motility protein PilT